MTPATPPSKSHLSQHYLDTRLAQPASPPDADRLLPDADALPFSRASGWRSRGALASAACLQQLQQGGEQALRAHGTLFEGPFKAIHVHTTPYLLHLCHYIHANPVKDGLVADLCDWPYSNYPEWLGLRNGVLYDPDFVREHFCPASSYAAFVSEYLRERKTPAGLAGYLAELEA